MFNFWIQAAWVKSFYPRQIAAIHTQTHPFPQNLYSGLEYFLSPKYWFSDVVLMHEPNDDDIAKTIGFPQEVKLLSRLWIYLRGDELVFNHYCQQTKKLMTHFSCSIADAQELAAAFSGNETSFLVPVKLSRQQKVNFDVNQRYTKDELRTNLQVFDYPWVRHLKGQEIQEIFNFLPERYFKQTLFRIERKQVNLKFLSSGEYQLLQDGLSSYLPNGLKSLILSPQEIDRLPDLNILPWDLIDTLLLGFRRHDAHIEDWMLYIFGLGWIFTPLRQLVLTLTEFPLACLKEFLAQEFVTGAIGNVLLLALRACIEALLFLTRLITSPFALAQEFQSKHGIRQTQLGKVLAWYARLYTCGLLIASFLPWGLGLAFGLALPLSVGLLTQFSLAVMRYDDLFGSPIPNFDRHGLLEERCFENNLDAILQQGLAKVSEQSQQLTDEGPLQVYQSIAQVPEQSSLIPNGLYFFKEVGVRKIEEVAQLPEQANMQPTTLYYTKVDASGYSEASYSEIVWDKYGERHVSEAWMFPLSSLPLLEQLPKDHRDDQLYCWMSNAHGKFHKLINLSQDYPELAARATI